MSGVISNGRGRAVYGAPRVPSPTIARGRLLDRIDPAVPLTIVRAPGGYGKTVLLAQWANGRAGSVAVWVALAPETADRGALWREVGIRLADAGLAEPGDALRKLVELRDDAADIRPLLRRAFIRLAAPVVLVLDDYHHVTDEEIHEDLLDLLMHCASLTVAVATRTASALERPAVALRLDRQIVTGQQLAFTLEETQEMLAQSGMSHTKHARLVHAASSGNPLLVRALVLQADGAADRLPEAATAAANWFAHDLLATTLAKADEQLQLYMLRTSVPTHFDAPLAVALTGSNRSSTYLETLERQGLLMRTDRQSGPLYQYHPIVHDVLRDHCVKRLPAEIDVLRATTARWAWKNDGPFAALHHAVQGHDYRLVSDILLHDWTRVLARQSLKQLLEMVPEQQVEQYPLIAMCLAVLYDADSDRRSVALRHFSMAAAAARVRQLSAPPVERVVLLSLEAAAMRLSGRAGQGVRPARLAIRALSGTDVDLRSLANQAGALRLENALTLLRAGHLAEARTVLSPNLAQPSGSKDAAHPGVIAVAATIDAFLGEMSQARSLLGRARAAGDIIEREIYPEVPVELAAALDCLERFDVAGARQHVAAVGTGVVAPEYGPCLALVQAYIDLTTGNAATGLHRLTRYLAAERQLHRASPQEAALLHGARTLQLLAVGRAGAALKEVQRLPPRHVLTPLLRAQIALLTNEGPEAVLSHLVVLPSREDLAPRVAVHVHALTAAARLHQADADAVHVALEEMAVLMREHGLRAHLMYLPVEDLTSLHRFALDVGSPLVAEALAAVDDVPDLYRANLSAIYLTDREVVILDQLRRTANAQAIAEALVVSPNTIKTQRRSLYRKLGARNRAEALEIAFRHGLLPSRHSS